MDEQLRQTLATWSSLVEPGDGVHHYLFDAIGPIEALQRIKTDASLPRIPEVEKAEVKRCIQRWKMRLGIADADASLELIDQARGEFITYLDPRYPERLNRLGPGKPIALWTRGKIPLPTKPTLALVGARAATNHGCDLASSLAAELGEELAVISGGAFGIDRAAHDGAMRVGHPTWAVLAGGVDRFYPCAHEEMFEEIMKNGAVLSEMPPGARPTRWRFLSRNRIIAALADAVAVVEAAHRSGALATARQAGEIGVEVGAVPGRPADVMSAGCNRLIRDGAHLISEANDVRQMLQPLTLFDMDAHPKNDSDELNGDSVKARILALESQSPLLKRVYDAMPLTHATSPTRIAIAAGLGLREVEIALMDLESKKYVERQAGNWIRR